MSELNGTPFSMDLGQSDATTSQTTIRHDSLSTNAGHRKEKKNVKETQNSFIATRAAAREQCATSPETVPQGIVVFAYEFEGS